jgi:hypothetical protein
MLLGPFSDANCKLGGLHEHAGIVFFDVSSGREQCPRKTQYYRRDVEIESATGNILDYNINGVEETLYTYGYWFEDP